MALPRIFGTLAAGNVPASYLDDNFNACYNFVPTGAGAVTTTVPAKLAQYLSVFDFLTTAQIADVQARTHLLDITVPVQAAITAAGIAGYGLFLPSGDYTTTAPLNINAGLVISGVGAEPSIGAPLGTGQRGPGTWFYLNHAGKGLWCAQPSAGTPISGIELRNFGTFRPTQTLPSAGAYVPAALDYDIYCDNVDILIDNVMLLNATAGVYFTAQNLNGYARLDINRLRGQVFNDFVHIVAAFDVCKLSNLHRWPFWTAGSAFLVQVQTYENANANCIWMARADSPMFSNIFCFNVNAGIRFAQNAFGTTTYLQAANLNFDNAIYGLYVDNTVTTGMLAQIDNLVVLAPSTGYITGSNNILVNGNHAQIDLGKCELRQAQQNGVQVNGANNRVTLGGPTQIVFYNQSASTFAGIQVNGTLNNIVAVSYPVIDTAQLLTVGTLTGTGTNGVYTGIVPTGAVTGSNAVFTVTVTGGNVTGITVTFAGSGYALTDTLSFTIPGGSGTCKPATISSLATRYGGAGASGNRIWVDEWLPYTPSVSSSTGTITTVGALNCWYKHTGSTVTINFDITITTNGTGATVVNVTIPPTALPVNVPTAGFGRELNNTGKQLQTWGAAAQSFFQIAFYDNTYPGSSGCRLSGYFSYEIQGLFVIP